MTSDQISCLRSSLRIVGTFLASVLATGCEAKPIDEGAPVAAERLCGEIAELVCDTEASCCDGAPSTTCVVKQSQNCDETIGALIDDPRLAYSPAAGGRLLAQLEVRAAGCWAAPFRYSEVVALFQGSGDVGADCTPSRSDSAQELSSAALSCRAGTACRLHLAADGTPQGFCEARATSDATACSHAYDCTGDSWCNLPTSWRPGDWGRCQPLRADGWDCNSSLECASGYCGASGCAARAEPDRCLTATYSQLILSRAPIAYLRLGERSGMSAADSSGTGNAAIYSGVVERVSTGAIMGDTNGALALSGMGGHVAVSALEGLTSSGEITIELWLSKTADAAGPLFELVEADGAALRVRVGGSRIVASFLGAAEETPTELESPEGAITDGFHHIAISYGDRAARIFVDGAQVAELAGAREIPVDAALTVGFHAAAEVAQRSWLSATFDELAIYPNALSSATLSAHVSAGRSGSIENDFVLFGWTR